MTTLFASLVDAAIMLAVALTATVVLQRRSAALRHAILATAVVASLAMPALELLLPHLPVIRWGAPDVVVSSGATLASGEAISGAVVDESATAVKGGIPWATLFVVVWTAIALATGGGLIASVVKLRRLRSRCVPATGRWRELIDELSRECGLRRHVPLLQSNDPSLLVTCGVLTSRIILPAGAPEWTEDRMRIVLRHELAHIRRHDAVIQIAGELLRVVQGINPLVWIACRRLRQESEYACDDAVLSGGVEATDYATHLLEVARHLSGRPAAWISAPAIAHPSTLERRIVAMLHRHRNRAAVSRRGWSVAAFAALAVSVPLAAAGIAPVEPVMIDRPANDVVRQRAPLTNDANADTRPPAGSTPLASAPRPAVTARPDRPAPPGQATATLAGSVLDQSGGTLPGTQLTLTDTQTGTQLMVRTDAAGRFAFRNLQPGQYELAASLVGFATMRHVLPVASGDALQRTITLPLGSIQESITLVCSAPAVNEPVKASSARSTARDVAEILSAAARLPHRVMHSLGAGVFPVLSAQERPIRVGGSIKAPKKIKDVKPMCPSTAPAGETRVRLTGRVSVDGFIDDLTPVPADAGPESPTELVEAALVAVRQWVFTPTLLNKEPVDVNITVDILFRKS